MDSAGFDQLLWRAARAGDTRAAAIAQKALGRTPIYTVHHSVRIDGKSFGEERGNRFALTEAEAKQIEAMSRREAIDETFAIYQVGRLRYEFVEDYPGDTDQTLKLSANEAKSIVALSEFAAREAICKLVRSNRFTVAELLSAFSVDSRREDELPPPPPLPEYSIATPSEDFEYEESQAFEDEYYDPETPVDIEGDIIKPFTNDDHEEWDIVERFQAADDAAAREYLEKHYGDRSGDWRVLDCANRDITEGSDTTTGTAEAEE